MISFPRIIARPFTGTPGHYKLINSGRKDYAVKPPRKTILDSLCESNYNVIGIGNTNIWRRCIPYNDDTKHLIGSADDCPEYYKWWEHR